MLNFPQLYIFVTIVESGGFIAASQVLHRSQPAITQAIHNLEAHLGFMLFNRKHYRPQLTPKGEMFYLHAKALVKQFKELENHVDTLRSDIELRLAIDLDIALPITDYTATIQALIQTYPQTCFSLSHHTFVQCVRRLKNKECNICLAACHVSDPEIEYLPLTQIQMLAVTSQSYNATYHEQINDPAQSHICMQIMIADTQQALSQLHIEPLSPLMPQWLVNDMYTRKQLIVAGMGIGRLPYHLIEQELKTGELIELNPRHYSSVTMDMYAMRLQHSEHGVVANHLWQELATA